jgi:hypothetical protein
MIVRPQGSAPRDVSAPRSPQSEAYRLCQPMHVLSFAEGRSVFVCMCDNRVRLAPGERGLASAAFGRPFHALSAPGGAERGPVLCCKNTGLFVRNINSCEHMFYFAPSRVERPIA